MAKIDEPLVSVIVPVYNVEAFIDECIDSIVVQTYKNLEIILVNDATPDRSGEKSDEWAKKDDRIKVVHKQKNEGLNMARATGLSVSNGGWVSFIDSDDFVNPDYIQDLFRAATDAEADIAIARNQQFTERDKIDLQEKDGDRLVIKNKDDIMRYVFVESPDPYVYMIVTWGKLFRRQLIDGIDWKFADARANEDELEAIQYYHLQKKGIVVVKKTLYYYRDNPSSIMGKPYANLYNGKALTRYEWLEKLYDISTAYFGLGVYTDELLYHNLMLNLLFLNKDLSRGTFTHQSYEIFSKNVYPKLEQYKSIREKYPFRYEEKRAFDCIDKNGDLFSLWSNDRQVIDELRQSNDDLRRASDELRQSNDNLHRGVTNLQRELDEIKSSRLWRVRDRYRAILEKKW